MMKTTSYLAALAALTLTVQANAGTINITGSSAYRAAVLTAIKAGYAASLAPFQYVHDQAAGKLTSATNASFSGTFNGIPGDTVINCQFTGSASGIRSLALGATDTFAVYYAPGLYTTAAAIGGGETALNTPVVLGTTGVTHQVSDIAFSDVSAASTPYGDVSFDEGAATTTGVFGIVVFSMVTNNGSPIANITSEQYRAVVTQGFQPLSAFTGNSGDSGTLVFAEGRNDDSGTRTTTLAETGYGITVPVQQYYTAANAGGAITVLQLTPANSAYSSSIWEQDEAGNGGYNTGGSLRADFNLTSSSVTIEDDLGNIELTGQPVWIVSTLGTTDAAKVVNGSGSARLCQYNGEGIDLSGAGNTFSTHDVHVIQQGAYSLWGYERQYIAAGEYVANTHGTGTVADTLVNNITPMLSSAGGTGNYGINVSTMVASRSVDGGLVAP